MKETPLYIPAKHPLAAAPLRTAAGTALAYMLMCVLYIIYSGRYAAAAANTPHDLQHIETAKGIAFIVVTGLVYFVVSYMLFRRIHRQETTIAAQQMALLRTERKIMGAMSFAIIAHDLNNLLMTLSAVVEDLNRQREKDPSMAPVYEGLENKITTLSHLCKRIASSTAHVLPDKQERIDIHDAIPKLVAIARKHPDTRFSRISIPEMPALSLVLNRVLLEEAILNLLINAAQATGPNGRIELRVRCETDHVLLAVHDDGPGVPENQIESIFDPCFTTKPDGSGIGLVAVKAFAASCGGTIAVSKSPLGGALFEIRIPTEKKT
jgi:signal transduction histidine kinase